jgi:hypothetical protein
MFPRLMVLVTLAAFLSAPARSQDSQSLGDVARQLRSQKSTAQPKMIVTNDDLPSASTVAILGLSKPAAPAAATSAGPESSPLAALAQWESVVNQIGSMDRATLLKLALQGVNPDFPGRASWEERLFAAKQAYVTQGLGLIQQARQLLVSAQSLKNAQAGADDPRVKELSERLQGLVQASVRADAAFQAVILEGRDLAHPPPAH